MDFMAELDSMDLPASLHEAVSGAYSALFEEFSPEVLAAIRNGMFESASSVLYHFVTAGNLCQMIRNNRFTPSDHESSLNGGKRFMSFSRTGNFEEGWPALFYSSSNSDDWCMVRLTIDGDRFNTHPNVRDSAGKQHPVTFRPTDWRHAIGKTPGKEAMMASRGKHLNKFTGKDLPDSQGHPWAQSEDRLLTDSDQIPGFLDYVKRIDIILKMDACTGDNESVRRALERNLKKIAGTGKVHVFASLADFKKGAECPVEAIAPKAIHESSETITPMLESEHTRRLQEVYTLMQEAYDKLKVTFDSAVKAVKGIPALAKRIAKEENIPYDEAYARAKEKADPFSMIAPHGRIVVKLREGMPGVMCRMQHVKPTVDNFSLSVVFDFEEYANSYYDTNMNMVVICLKPLIERAHMAVAPDIRSQIVHGEHLTLDTVWDVEDLFAILNDDSIQQVMMHELAHHVQDRVGELPDRKGYTRFFEENGLPDDDATYHDVLPHEINAEMISRLRDCFYLYSKPRAMTQIAKELYDYYMKNRLRYVPELPQHVYDRMKRQCWEIAVSMARAFVQSFEKNNGDWSKSKEKAIVRDLDSFGV